MLGIEGLAEASIKGDPKWAEAARWTRFAPPVVLTVMVLSIIEIVVGVLWIVDIDRNNNMNFGQVIQPLIIPGLSFFNAIPSAHLHILARANPPHLAVWFSGILCVVFLVSSLLWLGACSGSNYGGSSSLQHNECPSSAPKSTWDAMVALQLVSGVLYGVHAAMGWRVNRFHKTRQRGIEAGTIQEVVDEDARAKREQEARDRWKKIVDL